MIETMQVQRAYPPALAREQATEQGSFDLRPAVRQRDKLEHEAGHGEHESVVGDHRPINANSYPGLEVDPGEHLVENLRTL